MQKLSLAILGFVGLFVVAIVVILVVRGRSVQLQRDPSNLAPTRADLRVREVHLQEEGKDNVLWTLDADQAEVYEREGRTLLRGVTVTIQEPARTWNVTGEEGELVDANKDVVIRKNVVLISSDGIRLETEWLRWRSRDKRVWTDAPVTIHQKGAIIRGNGLENLMAEERTAVKGRVHATFTRARPASASPATGRSPAR